MENKENDKCYGCIYNKPLELDGEIIDACWHGGILYGDDNSCSGYTVECSHKL
ncbi:hypothetical protein Mahau_0565 [Mahella australiensis 50-1 BON]|uniref:Uncharacterized protein n=1 Tax=Mahella australiensis (strain DSM 15567 / CIP 107919 / 50-1 BON) TaxID=697281 RepID=F3ZZF8_MAHA5|nr:hypothetical protein Mahau_0565 [Mahella australiensis 50-1 BON]